MINLKAYAGSSNEFLDKVIASKRKKKDEKSPYYKDRVLDMTPLIYTQYKIYDLEHLKNNLISLKQINFSESQKDDLLELYRYSSKPFIELKNQLTQLPNNRFFNTCQYCTINSINTLDHIVPKSKFPEYAVHPKNLFPACSECNSSKTEKWLKNNTLEFLNLYLDQLPDKQYLFVNIKNSNGTFDVNFYLENRNNIDTEKFERIFRHFTNLNLLERFNKKSNEIISEFENTILPNVKSLGLEECLTYVKNKINLERNRIGINHYKNVIELELCEGNAFREYFLNFLKKKLTSK